MNMVNTIEESEDEYVAVVDFGSQFVQLIVRRVRELGAECVLVPYKDWNQERSGTLKAVILSGSPSSVSTHEYPQVPEWVFKRGIPVLGICYGQQVLCKSLGGVVDSMGRYELGRAFIERQAESSLLEGLGSSEEVWMSHGDKVMEPPEGFKIVASSQASPCAAIADEQRRYYGVQFHPEVVHTPCGRKIIDNFLFKIAGCKRTGGKGTSPEKLIAKIRQDVGDEHVLCAVSGGVDSSVLFSLLHKAIGKQVTGIFIDTGLMRKGEGKEVASLFARLGASLVCVDGSSLFLERLKGVEDPEEKRKIIGHAFIELFEAETKKLPKPPTILAQGTLYPDVIESSATPGSASVVIKSHHNVGGLPEKMNMRLLEPFRMHFKDEVRTLGEQLRLPEEVIHRHPFPGPGLAIRIMGEITDKRLAILREADAIYIEEIRRAGLYRKIWQAFAVLTCVRSVGVVGDDRSYDYVCALRAVTSVDGMTADFYPFDLSFLGSVATRLVNEVEGIGRVTYDITSKPPATVEWE